MRSPFEQTVLLPIGDAAEPGGHRYKRRQILQQPAARKGIALDHLIDSEWGIGITMFALVLIIGIFGSALWFIFHASDTNRRFRWLQVFRWNRKRGASRHGEASADRSDGGAAGR